MKIAKLALAFYIMAVLCKRKDRKCTGCLAGGLSLPVEHHCLTATPLSHSQEDSMQVHLLTTYLRMHLPRLLLRHTPIARAALQPNGLQQWLDGTCVWYDGSLTQKEGTRAKVFQVNARHEKKLVRASSLELRVKREAVGWLTCGRESSASLLA